MSLVATNTAMVPAEVLRDRILGLVDAGWDARLLAKGGRWEEHPAVRDPGLAGRVAVSAAGDRRRPPRALLRHPRRLTGYLRAPGATGPHDQRLLALRPDLVHFHSGWAAWKGLRLKPILGCRVVVGFREDAEDLRLPDLDRVWDGADLLLFPSEAVRERAAARGCPPGKAEVLETPPPAFAGAEPAREPRNGSLRVLSVGWVTWEQGLEHAVHAVGLLRDQGVECEYRILGDGDHLPAVAFARHQLGLAERVKLLGADDGRLVTEVRDADVLVCPAVTGTTSSTALRTAQALGVPCVATPRPDLPEDVTIGVPRRDPHAIAAALRRLAGEPALGERTAHAARVWAGAHPAADDVAALDALYRRALA